MLTLTESSCCRCWFWSPVRDRSYVVLPSGGTR